jgi:ribosome-binding factor A
MPHLAFKADWSFDRAGRIDQVLRRPRVRRDLAEGEGNGHES